MKISDKCCSNCTCTPKCLDDSCECVCRCDICCCVEGNCCLKK